MATERMRARLANGNDLVLVDVVVGDCCGDFGCTRYLRLVELEREKPYGVDYLVKKHTSWRGEEAYISKETIARAEKRFERYVRKHGLYPDDPKKCIVPKDREFICRHRERLANGNDILAVENVFGARYYVVEVPPEAEFTDLENVLRVVYNESCHLVYPVSALRDAMKAIEKEKPERAAARLAG